MIRYFKIIIRISKLLEYLKIFARRRFPQHIASLPGDKWEHPDAMAVAAIVDRLDHAT